jgi:hypothetical protein
VFQLLFSFFPRNWLGYPPKLGQHRFFEWKRQMLLEQKNQRSQVSFFEVCSFFTTLLPPLIQVLRLNKHFEPPRKTPKKKRAKYSEEAKKM